MWAEPLLFLLSLGLGVSEARPAAEATTTLAVKPTSTVKPQNCFNKGCTVEQVPVWDDLLGKCVCKWSLGPFPEVCEGLLCIAEMEVKYDPVTGKCGCYWIPGFGPYAAEVAVREAAAEATPEFPPCAIPCRTGYRSEQSSITGICSCVKDPPCPGMVCISEKHPVYNYTSGQCACQWIDDDLAAPTIIYPPPASSAVAITTKPSPTPSIVPCAIRCAPGYHLENIGSPSKCKCVPDLCPDIICIAEMHAVYDATTQKCGCQWIPGLEPSLVTLAARAAETSPIVIHPSCPLHTYCISEMRLVYDPELKRCTCKWIPGLEPTPLLLSTRAVETSIPITKPCPIRCRTGYHLQYDEFGDCFCEIDRQPCYIRCALGYHTRYNALGQCYCAKDAEPLPCGIRCIEGYHLETSLDTGKCSCVKDPNPVVSVRAAEPSPTNIIGLHPCATIKCGKGYHTFINEKGVCSCVKDAEPLPCGVKCKAGYHLETSLDTGKCSCVKDADPEPCVLKCKAGYHLESNPDTGTCSCVLDPVVVISEEELCLKYTACLIGHPVWNSDTQTCTCSSDDTPAIEGRQSISCCAATLCLVGTHPVCRGKKCICELAPDNSEQLCLIATTCLTGSHPVWNAATRKCSCVANANPQEICLMATTCLVGSEPVWNAGTQTCTCQANAQTICETATECIPGWTPIWSAASQICRCVPTP